MSRLSLRSAYLERSTRDEIHCVPTGRGGIFAELSRGYATLHPGLVSIRPSGTKSSVWIDGLKRPDGNAESGEGFGEMGMLAAEDARNALQVGRCLDIFEAAEGEQVRNSLALAEADFKQKESAGPYDGRGGGDQAAEDVEALCAGEQRKRRFVIADFNGKRWAVGFGDVRGIG